MKALIIGAAGFVGGHLINFLSRQPGIDIFASKLKTEKLADVEKEFAAVDLDILCKDEVSDHISRICPDYIINLAALSSVSHSWKEPALTFDLIVIGTIICSGRVRMAESIENIIDGSLRNTVTFSLRSLPIKRALVSILNAICVSKVSQEMVPVCMQTCMTWKSFW
jgi:UDP-glucose 4-epimerase